MTNTPAILAAPRAPRHGLEPDLGRASDHRTALITRYNRPMTDVRRSGLVIGSSDGIGRQLVERLLALGWTVTGVSRSPSERISEDHEHHVLDVTAAGYREALAALCERRGPFDAAVYCAGVGEPLVLDALADQRAAFEVNLLGAIDTFAVLAPAWRAARRGHFVVLSSLADKLIGPGSPGYNASKAAVTSYFESLALAVRSHGIAITNLRFGFVDTKMAKSPVRPFMMSRERAVREIERALVKRPIRRSSPYSMAMLCAALGWIMQCRVLLG
jgi:NAD(P)-dependent dehydrogenase (short-subunit alcohol dehydrogenase family)